MLNDLQTRLLEMLEWFHNLCINNNINYYLAYGSMLGAIRHKGFIPWDDDIDVVLPRPDYEKLSVLIGNKKVDKYYLETVHSKNNDYLYGYSKLYDTSTTLVEHTKLDVVRGVFIDVFPLDALGNTYDECLKNYKNIDILNMFLAARICAINKDRKLYKNLAIILASFIPKFAVNEKKLLKKLDRLCSKLEYDKYSYIANCMSTYRTREIMNKSIYGKPTKYKFENLTVYGPEYYDEYLTILYHNWRELPPPDKRKTAHTFNHISLSESYMK